MREIELKAHAGDCISVRKNLEKLYGEGKDVHKSDHYFRRPGESIQAMRIRSYNGIIEMTCKKTSVDGNGENNFEYEFQSSPDQLEPAIRFFHALGLEDFFVKKKDGLEWYGDGAHIELLSVNDLGRIMQCGTWGLHWQQNRTVLLGLYRQPQCGKRGFVCSSYG